VRDGTPENVELIAASTRDNPFLPPSYLERLRQRYPKALLDAYLEGKFTPLRTGLVYAAYDAEKNSSFTAYEPNVDLLWSHDFNVDPLCSVLVQKRRHKSGREYFTVVDEIVLTGGARTVDAAKEFLSRYGKRHTRNVIIYGDASGGKRSTRGAKSDFQILREELSRVFGEKKIMLKINRGNPPLKDSINAVNALFENGVGERRLFINKQAASRLHESLLMTVHDGEGGIRKDGAEHLTDALRYLIFREEPVYKPRVKIQGV
jgi:hypothetical protein